MNQKKVKTYKSISISQFLRDYVGIIDEDIIQKHSRLTHFDLKEEFREKYHIPLISISYDDVITDDLLEGKVLLVEDVSNHLAPYLNPRASCFDKVIEESEKQRQERIKEKDQPYDEYIDSLDNIALDEGTKNSHIKSLGFRRTLKKG